MTSPSSVPPSAPADLAQLVETCLGRPISGLVRMPGGLSTRQFFRVQGGDPPAVAMWLPEDAPERVLARRLGRRLPFIEVRELLEGARVRVPSLLGAAPERGLLVVEDLGETLEERLSRSPTEREPLYRRAVVDLARAQLALAKLPEDCIASTRSFDRELLTWELEHFREWGVEALGVTLTSGEASSFLGGCAFLVETMLGFERGFVHRDYQSRNLMALPGGELAWIDFQDALLGPRAYDLVALLRDSYQNLDEPFVAARLAEFADARGLSSDGARALRFELDVITVQRKLKDAGRFVFFERQRGDPSYLRYVAPTLELVLGALGRLGAHAELSGLTAIVQGQLEIARTRGMLPA